MGIESWLFLVSVLCSLAAIFAVIMVVKLGQNNYGNGYAQGYQNGANEKYNEVYKKRLLRQSRRIARTEKKIATGKPEDQEPIEDLLDLGLTKEGE